ncbi:thymidylate synthase [Oscillochloris trichoides DG-6]|uniref:Thymidylate synthase n=1 Tax=Oscillochloris trichoides DG-6 TaxID=765420 RepID=E1IC42_9CHLR|nr:thymidylate synthase [Oscillochloris trichoides]EFO81232.1 thymidylate synthase [Oscillochloris trichoides DG-6]
MAWPPFFAQSLSLGNPGSGVAICLLWTPQERVLPALNPDEYALVGNLYSRDGISFMLRTLLARPTIRTILLCGKDMTGSGTALLDLWEGQDAVRLHPEIPPAAVDLVRQNVTLHDARDLVRPEEIAALLHTLHCPAQPFAPAAQEFPYAEPVAASLPAAACGLLVRAATVREAYLHLIWNVLSFGVHGGTQHSSNQREILDVLTVVSAEPGDPAAFSHAEWMPFTRASLGERLPNGGYSGYLGQILTANPAEGVSYTYGARLRTFDGQIDQVAAICADLRSAATSRRALAVLWNPHQDAGSANPPCLNLVQARLRPAPGEATPRLFLTVYFRSHDIFRAWPANAYALRALQALIAEELGGVELGDLAILSHSAHIYAHDWEAAAELLAQHYRPQNPRLIHDQRGAFVIVLEPPVISVRHYSPAGEHLQTFRGNSARELSRQIAPYIGEMSHALYLGQELQKAEIALALGRPDSFHQDRPLTLES